jgi:hypothetical protein
MSRINSVGMTGTYRGYSIISVHNTANQFGGRQKKQKYAICVNGKQKKFKTLAKVRVFIDQLELENK